ncbi:IclR family transcriptional regulator [Agrococcus sediminis]|uniref:IclR family transcriptional regulator n=1 Tax=Agrococcus sediminis TaxID=2599924 RepID=UPI0037FC7407
MAQSTAASSGEHRGTIGALLKGLQLLDLFSSTQTELSIGQMAASLGVHKSSASRIAATLAGAGYLVVGSAPGYYRLGQRLVALGTLARARNDVTEIVMPSLNALVEATGETGHLAVLRGEDTTTVGVVDGWHTVRMHSYVGKTAPAYVSSMGKALLAGLTSEQVRELISDEDIEPRTEKTVRDVDALERQLQELRETGYGLDDEELEIGLRCIAAPIFAPDGQVDASISISGPSQRVTLEFAEQLAEHVRWHAWRASVARGTTRVPDGWADPPSKPPPALSHL